MRNAQKEKRYWSRGRELNSRPADYESAALPLSYLGLEQKTTLASAENCCQFISKPPVLSGIANSPLPSNAKSCWRTRSTAECAADHQRENGYMAQPIPMPNSRKSNSDHAIYFTRSMGRRRLRKPNAMDIKSANSSMACKWLR